MANTRPTTAVTLRKQLARDLLRIVPRQVRVAYGAPPHLLRGLAADNPLSVAARAAARASLIGRGWLTEEDLDTLPVEQAERVALQRLRDSSPLVEIAERAQRGERRRRSVLRIRPNPDSEGVPSPPPGWQG